MGWAEPLDLKYWLVDTLSGSWILFFALGMIFISGMSAYFRFPKFVTISFIVFFGLLVSNFVNGLYTLIIIIFGLITFYIMSKITEG